MIVELCLAGGECVNGNSHIFFSKVTLWENVKTQSHFLKTHIDTIVYEYTITRHLNAFDSIFVFEGAPSLIERSILLL